MSMSMSTNITMNIGTITNTIMTMTTGITITHR
jgi:hypothetical protein